MTEQKQELILANELRIGNYLFDDTDRYFQVEQIKGTLVESKGGYMYDLGYCNGIPLTEEILLKCGFKFNDNSHRQISKPSIFIEELRYVYKINDFEIRLFKGRYYYNNIEIKYLHQLQNLYFALTNQELNIEL